MDELLARLLKNVDSVDMKVGRLRIHVTKDMLSAGVDKTGGSRLSSLQKNLTSLQSRLTELQKLRDDLDAEIKREEEKGGQ